MKKFTSILALAMVMGSMVARASEPVTSTHGNFISVADFGAVADDDKDDVKAIQAALDYSRDNGLPIIYFPKGVYLIGQHLFDVENSGVSSSLHVFSGQTLIFENGAILRRSKASVTHMLFSHNEPDAVGYIGCHDITIIGATVDENAAFGTKDTAFNFSHGDRINVIGCEFYGASDWHSIEINSCRNVLIDKCTFRDNRNTEDIQLDAALASGNIGKDDHTVCHDIVISNCRFKTDGHYSIGNHSNAPHHDILIKDNWFSGTGVDGQFFTWVPLTHSVTVTGSHMQ